MATLPQELIDRICEYLTRQNLKNTTTVSRSFQHASKRASGAYATFNLTETSAEKFLSRYAGRCWAYFRLVRFRTHLPAYKADKIVDTEDKSHYCRESKEKLEENNRLFTKQIGFVFTTLNNAEKRGNLQLAIFTPILGARTLCPHQKYVSCRLHLRYPDTLPSLDSIRAFSIEGERIVNPLEEDKLNLKITIRILIHLAVKFPCWEYLGSRLNAGSPWTTHLSIERSEAIRHYNYD
jgi:hypothetical protein